MRMLGWFLCTCALLLSFMVLCAPEEAQARVGSGQDYDGGGSSSSGSADGGSPDLPLGVALGIAALAFLIFIVGVKIVAARSGVSIRELSEQGKAAHDRARATMGQGSSPDLDLTVLTATDPAFDIDALCVRVSGSVVALQEAWSKRDLQPCRAFLSDGVYNRFATNLELLARAHQHNQMSQIRVTGVSPVGVRVAGGFQILDLGIRAVAVDRTVDTRTGERVSGSDTPSGFTELWSLMRRPGVDSRANVEGMGWDQCPQCSAPMTVGAASRCAHCKALINSGAYDWVLAEITQLSAVARIQRPTQGVELLDAHESLSLQGLEDRASTIFWALIETAYLGETAPLQRLADPALLESLTAQLDAAEPRRVLGKPAVETVDAREIRAEADGLRATVAIRWSGVPGRYTQQEGVEDQGKSIRGEASLALSWSPAAEPRAFRGLASAGCSSCGGPLDRSDQASCPWCSQPLAVQPGDWVLVESSFHGHG